MSFVIKKTNYFFSSFTNSPTVVNKYKSSYDVYIGRGSVWGNPFTVEQYGRDKCIAMYKEYILLKLSKKPELMTQLMELENKKLGCFCKPKKCHGDILVELFNEIRNSKTN